MRAQGVRVPWGDVAAAVRERVEATLGSAVVSAETQAGGFSPGVAARCGLADGRRCFVKATSPELNPEAPDIYRREAHITSRLPDGMPVPRLLETVELDGWVVLVFEEVDGRCPDLPWSLPELAATFIALSQLADATTPCPVPELPTIGERFATAFSGFRQLAAGDPTAARLDPWTSAHLDRLAALESEWDAAAAGGTLLHTDLRADNLLVRPDGSVVVVDWPHACVGAGWVDLALMLPAVGLDGGPSPSEVELALDPLAGADPAAVDRVVTALAGYFTFQGLQPDPPGLPTLRAFQRAQGEVTCAWLEARGCCD